MVNVAVTSFKIGVLTITVLLGFIMLGYQMSPSIFFYISELLSGFNHQN